MVVPRTATGAGSAGSSYHGSAVRADTGSAASGWRPIPRTEVSAFPLDDELVLYEPEANSTYVLNPTAAFIWSLCDGERTLQEVAEDLADAYGIDEGQALTDASALLDDLKRAGFLVDAAV